MSDYQALDTLMTAYLGPAGQYITGTEDSWESVDFFLKNEPDELKHEVISDIIAFESYNDDVESAFYSRYRHANYAGSPIVFLTGLKHRIQKKLGIKVDEADAPNESLVREFFHLANVTRTQVRRQSGKASNVRESDLAMQIGYAVMAQAKRGGKVLVEKNGNTIRVRSSQGTSRKALKHS
ncbi:hypothetical protein [Yersinia enterocolitica]|nr:hypothetical protein [Yersinia enterocolitica]EKN5944395.1 hypothetical protein [Yersinia enterocolitica]ELW7379028.1 hypothetical protein [Yersinia enterocolitica]